MKKIVPLIALSMLALMACEKGTVSGTVIDPFTGKPVELPTVWIKGTTFSSQKIPGGLPDGTFKFEGVEPGSYTLEAGKGRYSKGKADFVIGEGNMEVTANIYIYGQEVEPGLYRSFDGAGSEKITNDWVIWQPMCKAGGFVLRTKFTTDVENPSTKKKEKKDMVLPKPREVPANVTALYKIKSSVSSPIEVTVYPIISAAARNYADCSGIGAKETLKAPVLDKGKKIDSDYKSENLYEIKGTLLDGEQLMAIRQDGKLLSVYYLNAK